MYKHLRRVLELYKNRRGALIISQVFLAMGVLLNLIIVSLNGRLVNEGVQKGDIEVVVNIVVWMVGLALVQTVFTVGNALYAVLFAEGTANYLRTETFRTVQSLSFGNLDRYHTSDLLVRLTSDINNIKFAVLYGFMLLLQAPLTIVLTIILTILLAPTLVWMMVGAMVLVGLVLFWLIRGLPTMYEVLQKCMDNVTTVLQEGLAGVRVVKAFNREAFEIHRFETVSAQLQAAALAPAYKLAAFLPALMTLVYLFIAVLMYTGGNQVFAGAASLGTIVVFSNLLINAIVPMALLAFIMPYFQAGEASAQRLIRVLEDRAEVQDKPGTKPLAAAIVRGRIVFENVSFGYRDEKGVPQGHALQNINLTVEPGETVGFLGATGSGKSTLVNLVPRFYDVCEGRVTIDDVDVRDIPLEQIRQIVSPVLQEAVLFSGTVRGNILFGETNAEEDVMLAASRAADADSFVSKIPEAYDAPVARRGANFSGGQRQRLSIARALATRPKILILDDSTSALDLATEARVQTAIQSLMADAVKLYVAQRISTVMTADQIVLLDGGRQVAVGAHAELLQSNSLYREIYESQLGKIHHEANGGAQ